MQQQARTTLITGATGELGSALVAHFSGLGDLVTAVARPDKRARLEELSRLGPHVHVVAMDASQSDAWVEEERWQLGGTVPHAAVLAAGGYFGGKPLAEETTEGVLEHLLDANLRSAYRALSALLKGMLREGRGSIVLIGSKAAARPWESAGSSAYAASKAALLALAQSAAAEVIGQGVRINVVLPSTIDTAPNRSAMPEADTSGWVSKKSLCEVIEFLLSDRARGISGAAIPVYGGRLV